jgi:uncharacterized protein
MSKIEGLYVYPIKSLRGISLNSSVVDQWGLSFDREWMLVDEQGKFLSQRQMPQLAQFEVRIEGETMRVSHGMDSLDIDIGYDLESTVDVKVWDSRLKAHLESDKVNKWFSRKLNASVRLVRYGNQSKREQSGDYGILNVKFADAYPILIANSNSLDAFNKEFDSRVPMDRFRPNIVLGVIAAWQEASSKEFSFKDGSLHFAKNCQRCGIPSIDQTTGLKTSQNVLQDLIKMNGAPATFGVNAFTPTSFTLSVGDHLLF